MKGAHADGRAFIDDLGNFFGKGSARFGERNEQLFAIDPGFEAGLGGRGGNGHDNFNF